MRHAPLCVSSVAVQRNVGPLTCRTFHQLHSSSSHNAESTVTLVVLGVWIWLQPCQAKWHAVTQTCMALAGAMGPFSCPPSHGLQSVGTHSSAQWPSAHLFPAWRMRRLWITLGWRWTSSKIFCEPTTDCQDGPELLHLLRRRLFLRGAGNAHRSSTCVSHRPGRSPNL